jgi:hypothetical protein
MGKAKAFTGYTGPQIASFTELKPRIEPDCGITFVIGGNPNPFGHSLFRMGRRTGYVHVDELCDYPKFIPWFSFGTYLRENHKRILRELTIALPHPISALRKILELNYKKWPWFVIPHNCVAYCEEILHAGGSNWESISNLPLFIQSLRESGNSLRNA